MRLNVKTNSPEIENAIAEYLTVFQPTICRPGKARGKAIRGNTTTDEIAICLAAKARYC